jgi:hypothetical protein
MDKVTAKIKEALPTHLKPEGETGRHHGKSQSHVVRYSLISRPLSCFKGDAITRSTRSRILLELLFRFQIQHVSCLVAAPQTRAAMFLMHCLRWRHGFHDCLWMRTERVSISAMICTPFTLPHSTHSSHRNLRANQHNRHSRTPQPQSPPRKCEMRSTTSPTA